MAVAVVSVEASILDLTSGGDLLDARRLDGGCLAGRSMIGLTTQGTAQATGTVAVVSRVLPMHQAVQHAAFPVECLTMRSKYRASRCS